MRTIIYEWISSAIKENGHTVKWITNRLDIDYSTFLKYKGTLNMPLEVLLKFSIFYNLDLNDLKQYINIKDDNQVLKITSENILLLSLIYDLDLNYLKSQFN